MRKLPAAGLLSLLLAACGGGSSSPDAMPPLTNTGFVLPTKATHANMQDSNNVWQDLGAADWSCLGTPTTDVPRTVDLSLMGSVVDFQNMDNGVPNAMVDIFSDIDYQHPFQSLTADGAGKFTATIPTGKEHVGFKLHATNYMDTFLLNQYWDPAATSDTIKIGDISSGLASALPAFTDFDRVTGTGVLAGAFRDCQKHEVSNAIATVSSTSMTHTDLQGMAGPQNLQVIATTFYFSAGSTDLPVKHTGSAGRVSTNSDGLFAVFNLPPTQTAYIQVWGFKTDADVAKGESGLTLLAELPAPVLADNVITATINVLRTN